MPTVRPLILALALLAVLAPATSASPRARASVIGGKQADISEFPWMASIQFPGQGHGCGGSVVAPTKVLTAAHCLSEDAAGLKVRTGSTFQDRGGTITPVTAISIHPAWDPEAIRNDIAMLTLAQPVNVKPIRIVNASDPGIPSGTPVTMSGWGLISERPETTPSGLRMADLKMRSDGACTAVYGEIDAKATICAGGGRPDSCRGDSGGPLQAFDGTEWALIGLVSFGPDRCGETAGAYTRALTFAGWIAEQIGTIAPTPPPAPAPAPPARSNLQASIGHIGCGIYTCQVNVSTRGSTVGLAAMLISVSRRCNRDERALGICKQPTARYGFATRRSLRRWRITMPSLPLGEVRITAYPLREDGERIGRAGIAEGFVDFE